MPVDYTGSSTGITPHQAATIPTFLDTDACEAAIDNLPSKALADLVAYLMANAALRGAIETAVFKGAADGAAGDLIAAVELGGVPTNRKLETDFVTGNTHTRVYKLPSGDLEITTNAQWDGQDWVRDQAGNSTKLWLAFGAIAISSYPAASASPFSESAWVGDTKLGMDGRISFTGTTATASGSNPPAGTALSNTLVAKNICKAWGRMHIVDGAPVLIDGCNVKAVAADNGKILVTFPDGAPMADANYCVVVNGDQGGMAVNTTQVISYAHDMSQTGFHVSRVQANAQGNETFFEGADYSFVVYGRQG